MNLAVHRLQPPSRARLSSEVGSQDKEQIRRLGPSRRGRSGPRGPRTQRAKPDRQVLAGWQPGKSPVSETLSVHCSVSTSCESTTNISLSGQPQAARRPIPRESRVLSVLVGQPLPNGDANRGSVSKSKEFKRNETHALDCRVTMCVRVDGRPHRSDPRLIATSIDIRIH